MGETHVADRPSDHDDNDTPRWVKVFGIIGGVVVLLVVFMLFTGHGPGRHIPSDNTPAEDGQQ
jgi:hypothetical protein